AYRLLPMGLWSDVVPRSERVTLSEWASAWSENVRHWDLESVGRAYAASSWETSEGVWYTYALARLRALRDVAATLEPGPASGEVVAALALAERWPAARRADYVAYQAEFWRTFPSESLVTLAPARDSLFAARAMRLAGEALALDPRNLQALQTTATLMSS